MRIKSLLAVSLVAALPMAHAADSKLATEKQRLSYTIGFQMASQLRSDGIDVDPASLTQAITDVLSGGDLKLTQEEMQATVEKYRDQRMTQMRETADRNLKASEAFLDKNKKAKDIVSLPSGVQYKVMKKGGGQKPAPTDTVSVNYRGTLIDGTEFDSNADSGQPVTFPINGVIQGWQEVLPLMEEGAKWQVFIPPALAYGERGSGGTIGPNEALIFDIELVKVDK